MYNLIEIRLVLTYTSFVSIQVGAFDNVLCFQFNNLNLEVRNL